MEVDGDTVTITAVGIDPTTEVFLNSRRVDFTRVSAEVLRFVAKIPTGVNDIKVVTEPGPGGGGGESLHSFTSGTALFVPNEIIVFNDVNIFDNTGMDDDFDEEGASGGANPNNKLLATNLVSFTSSGSRNAGTVVQFDCGRSSGFSSACTDFTNFEGAITTAGLTVSDVPSSSGTLTSIPTNVKVLFLWLPKVAFTGTEINTLKQFVADGGRIVFVGEHGSFYTTTAINNVANPFLKDMGAKSLIKGGSFDCGFNTLPAASLNTIGHQVMTA